MKVKITAVMVVLGLLLSSCGVLREDANGEVATLTLACWIKDYPLSYCVEQFNHNNKKYQIEIHEYYDETEDNYTAAMTRMKLDLISNDNWDLIYLDSMDIFALENAGVLMDLLPLMEQDEKFQKEDYAWNIWEQYIRNGNLYEWIPAFELTGVIGPSKWISTFDSWNIEEYLSFVDATGQGIGSIQPETMLGYMLQYTNSDVIDTNNYTCHFDSQEFLTWMNFAKRFESDDGSLWIYWVRGFSDYLSWQMLFNDTVSLVNIPTTSPASLCASAHFSFGMSSRTQYSSACWKFLNQLMDDEVLSATTLGAEYVGFPMKKSILAEQLELAQLPGSNPSSLIYHWGEDAIPLGEDEAQRLKEQIASIQCVEKRISAVINIVSEESKAFFCGDKTCDETVKLIQNRVSIYLAEQQ